MGGTGIALSLPNLSARIPWPLYTSGKVTHYQRVEGVAQVYLFGMQTQRNNKKNSKNQKIWRVCLLINMELKGLNVSWILHNTEIINCQLQ
jgi:hypothetical protein